MHFRLYIIFQLFIVSTAAISQDISGPVYEQPDRKRPVSFLYFAGVDSTHSYGFRYFRNILYAEKFDQGMQLVGSCKIPDLRAGNLNREFKFGGVLGNQFYVYSEAWNPQAKQYVAFAQPIDKAYR